MIYLIDPTLGAGKCPGKCKTLCSTLCKTLCLTLCAIKPMYGVPTDPI